MTVYLAFVGGGHAGLLNEKADPNKTPGKETPYIKSLGRRIQEEEFNEPVAARIRELLKKQGVHVYDPAPGPDDVPLRERTNFANKIYWQYCDKYGAKNVVAVYVSVHFNAVDGKFDEPKKKDPSGFSVHIDPGSVNGRKLAQCILDELAKGTKQVNRGIKEQNLHITRETVMPAALSENGFMDNEREALLMLDKEFQREVAEEHARGICKYFGIKYKEDKKGDDEMLEKAVVFNSLADYSVAETVANRHKIPLITRHVALQVKLARELIVVGGVKDGLKADKFTVLSGKDRFETASKVAAYLK